MLKKLDEDTRPCREQQGGSTMSAQPHALPVGSGEAVVAAARHLFASGVMSHAGHANLSARLDAERFALTTTGMVRNLRPDQLATVNLDGEVLEGVLGPENAEIVGMHSVIYKARSDVGGSSTPTHHLPLPSLSPIA